MQLFFLSSKTFDFYFHLIGVRAVFASSCFRYLHFLLSYIIIMCNAVFLFLFLIFLGLLRLQQIYQGLRPGNETFQVETVKRITNVSATIDFLKTLEDLNRWSIKYIVLDCPTDMAKEIVVSHVRDLSLGRRTYHYLLSGLVCNPILFIIFTIHRRDRIINSVKCLKKKMKKNLIFELFFQSFYFVLFYNFLFYYFFFIMIFCVFQYYYYSVMY